MKDLYPIHCLCYAHQKKSLTNGKESSLQQPIGTCKSQKKKTEQQQICLNSAKKRKKKNSSVTG